LVAAAALMMIYMNNHLGRNRQEGISDGKGMIGAASREDAITAKG
jgi:hypothetical protein